MELVTDEKIRTKVLRSELKGEGLKLDSLVRCIHCGNFFYGNELRVFKKGDSHLVYCKFPDCDGSIIDIIDADDEDFVSSSVINTASQRCGFPLESVIHHNLACQTGCTPH